MRELTEQEQEAADSFFYKFFSPNSDFFYDAMIEKGYEAGFTAGLDYTQRKLDAYAAFVAGKITLKELEEVIK